ncbi:MAG: RimK family alpha-L-glutamate ligase [Clostridia bacterium]|nr:RimK family alpha-L-glutamate ligase [Clostridia bacterium]
MKGFVLINGYPSDEKFYRQGERIADALQSLGIQTDLYQNGEVYAKVDAGGNISVYTPKGLGYPYSFVVYLDKDKYLGRLLEKSGLRLFNSAQAIEDCDDKMQTYLALLGQDIPLAESIPVPLCYTKDAKPKQDFLQEVVRRLQFPMIVKKSYGSFGEGVQLVHGMPELLKCEEKWLHIPHFYQRYISDSSGRDIRVIVIGGKVVGAMERIAKEGEFRSNIELGGVGRPIVLEDSYRQTAEEAARALGLDYCGVDLLETPNGPIVCEVNSNAFFEGLERTIHIDVAHKYAEYIQACLQK